LEQELVIRAMLALDRQMWRFGGRNGMNVARKADPRRRIRERLRFADTYRTLGIAPAVADEPEDMVRALGRTMPSGVLCVAAVRRCGQQVP
jgi:hypothetical protein